jgi:hypothetical protein
MGRAQVKGCQDRPGLETDGWKSLHFELHNVRSTGPRHVHAITHIHT